MADLTSEGDLESKLWESAEKSRGNIELAQYKYVVLEILSIKAFSERKNRIGLQIPDNVNWDSLVDQCKATTEAEGIRKKIDEIVTTIEQNNQRDIIPRGHNRTDISDDTFKQLITLFDNIDFNEGEAQDPFGRVYEYLLREFALEEGKRSGEFYTPKCVVELLVRILEAYEGKIFDPFCGSGGMFIQSARFLEEHEKNANVEIYGQELKKGTWRICRANLTRAGLSIQNIEQGDSITNNKYKELRADKVITNPPFNMEDWGQNTVSPDDPRFEYGIPSGTGNFAFLQHMLHHTEEEGMVGTVMSNKALFEQQGGAGKIREQIIEDDLLDIVITLPDNLFYSTPVPASIWILSKGKKSDDYRDRAKETLLIDATELYSPVTNSLNELSESHINRIVEKIRSYRAQSGADPYRNEPGFCRRIRINDFRNENYITTPGTFVKSNRNYQHNRSREEIRELVDEVDRIFENSEMINQEIRETLEGVMNDDTI